MQDAQKKPQIKYLYRYLKDIYCKSVLVENEYVDHDFLDDYAAYYAKCFRPYKRFCRRAHFWSVDVKDINIPGAIASHKESDLKLLQESYLGFAVIKPLPDAVVGRTVLSQYDDDGGARKIRVHKEYEVNLYGWELAVKGLAFQEQDTVLAACATTALWSSFQVVSEKFRLALPTPSQITKSATKYLQVSRPIPSHGLLGEQMCSAISENGLVPEVQTINPNMPLNSLIFAYVSAGLPVILGYDFADGSGRHAVTVCGYRTEQTPQVGAETLDPLLDMNLLGRRITEFYVHDDGLGPFSRLKVSSLQNTLENEPRNPRLLVREVDGEPELTKDCLPYVVIVPLYHKIRLRFRHVVWTTRCIVRYFRTVGIEIKDDLNPHGFEWELRLVDLPTFKRKLTESPSIPQEMKQSLLTSSLPRYMWVASALMDHQRVMSFIADATDMERSFYYSYFVGHYRVVRREVARLIKERDPDLSAAAEAGLPTAFQRFIREQILL